MKSLFEEMGGTYTLGADGMYYPDLELPEEEPHYGKYGRMRLRYLKEHHKMLYNTLLLDGELVKHLNEVDDTANQRMELLTLQMQEQQGINEALKARDQMACIPDNEEPRPSKPSVLPYSGKHFDKSHKRCGHPYSLNLFFLYCSSLYYYWTVFCLSQRQFSVHL